MSKKVSFDYSKAMDFVSQEEIRLLIMIEKNY